MPWPWSEPQNSQGQGTNISSFVFHIVRIFPTSRSGSITLSLSLTDFCSSLILIHSSVASVYQSILFPSVNSATAVFPLLSSTAYPTCLRSKRPQSHAVTPSPLHQQQVEAHAARHGLLRMMRPSFKPGLRALTGTRSHPSISPTSRQMPVGNVTNG